MKARWFGMAALAVVVMVTGAGAQAAQSKLRVLYVGTDPQTVQTSQRGGENAQRRVDLMKSRAPAFEKLLRQHFTTVKVVYAPQYKVALSADYDVTIFDATPPVIRPASLERDPKTGQPVGSTATQYLTAAFDRPAVLIGITSSRIGEGLRYKMDERCQCLDAHAHDIRLDHPIFNTPNKVAPTLELSPTPQNYRMYYHGTNLPPALPMWRVQTEGYREGKGMEPGLISSGVGFTDGGDAEVISSGVNQKNIHNVALGRHGNFFHWGFAAAPEYMTPQARLAFVNAIHYIARFKGQRPYSHRDYRSAARDVVLDAAGIGREVLNFSTEGTIAQLGKDDMGKYLPYYEQNLEYLKPGARRFTYEVDEDVRSLGVSNRDPQTLELCVTLLESNVEPEKAARVLARYAGENFQAAAQWRKWLDANRSRLYFSDVDGFRFHLKPAK